MTKVQAINELQTRFEVRFGGDFFAEVNFEKQNALAEYARKCGYRKPRSASGSTGRYFYEHLSRYIAKYGTPHAEIRL